MSYQEPKNPSEYKLPTDKPSLVYVTASWCGPCKMMDPTFEDESIKNPNVVFIKVDAETCSTLPIVQSSPGVPTFVSHKNGVRFEQYTGYDNAKVNQLVVDVQK